MPRAMKNAPTVMAESAMLKTGQTLRSKKSMTYENLILSIVLPIAPPSTNIMPAPARDRLSLKPMDSRTIKLIDIKANRIRAREFPLKRPKAMPVLCTKVK